MYQISSTNNDYEMIDLAIEVAAKAHQRQVRKETDIPYITHPLSVGIILAKAGCCDDVIIAGILHDTVEDTSITLDYIREKFGDKVATMVQGASEPDKSMSWEDRKEHTIEFLKTAPLEIRLVTCADKLHNIRTIAADYAKIGDEVWGRFNRGKEDQEWYYKKLVDSLGNNLETLDPSYESLFQAFRREVEKLFGKSDILKK